MVGGSKPSRLRIGRYVFFEGALLDRETGVKVDLSGLDRFMPEPKSDDSGVVARFEELYGGCVAQDVGGYVLVDESRTLLASGSDILIDETLDGVATEDAAATTWEQRLRGSCSVLLEPVPKNVDRLRRERSTTFLAPFTSASDVSTRLKRDVFALQVDEL